MKGWEWKKGRKGYGKERKETERMGKEARE